MTCTIYCACAVDDGCCNPYTAKDYVNDAVDDTSEDDDQFQENPLIILGAI